MHCRFLHPLGSLSSNTDCNKGPVAKRFHFDIDRLKLKEKFCPQLLLNCSMSSVCDVHCSYVLLFVIHLYVMLTSPHLELSQDRCERWILHLDWGVKRNIDIWVRVESFDLYNKRTQSHWDLYLHGDVLYVINRKAKMDSNEHGALVFAVLSTLFTNTKVSSPFFCAALPVDRYLAY